MHDNDRTNQVPTDKTPRRGAIAWAWGVLRLWFTLSTSVNRRQYAISGVSLMLFKYIVEAATVWHFTGSFFTPLDFFNPLLSVRTALLEPAPPWVTWGMFLWSLPFLWIAVSMSVRRAVDHGNSPWLGFLVLVPIVNLPFMIAMCSTPSRPQGDWATAHRRPEDTGGNWDAAYAVLASLALGGLMLLISVYALSNYGASLFLGTPFLMGAMASNLFNRAQPRSYAESIGIALASNLLGALVLLLFALEGVICIAMALPLMLPVGVMGGIMGKAIAEASRRPGRGLTATALALPLLAMGESLLARPEDRVVCTTVDIQASPSEVWEHVVSFPELPEARPWYFRLGIACPERAHITGAGPGAVRYCEFTTGQFVEPITVWDPPRRLAFNVTEQPDPMFELSPYPDIHPPHLDNHLESRRGEFRLVALPHGGTRLEGRTWYTLRLYPAGYWTIWSDGLIHRIHQRVLDHIQQLSEAGAATAADSG